MSTTPALGIRQNLPQFSLLVLINGFVGAMIGLERTILPLIAEQEFQLSSKSLILSFIVSFGIVKAIANLLTGHLAEAVGRKRLLVAGWLFALPVPVILMIAPSWNWVVAANVLLGINQGLCWSAAVIMKIDLAGPKQRGLAAGLNEFAGYVAVSLTALATGYIASMYGLRPHPFFFGIGIPLIGLFLSAVFVKETKSHAVAESLLYEPATVRRSFSSIFIQTSWKNRTLFACSQAGLVNNLNDGMVWGLFPLFFAAGGMTLEQLGLLAAVYPMTWGIVQLCTGVLSDRIGRKWMIVMGMLVQGIAIIGMSFTIGFIPWLSSGIALGIGTAMVYPTLLAAVSDVATPSHRATVVGVYRFWRDLGYAVGALSAGMLADYFSVEIAIVSIGFLTIISGILTATTMSETHRKETGAVNTTAPE